MEHVPELKMEIVITAALFHPLKFWTSAELKRAHSSRGLVTTFPWNTIQRDKRLRHASNSVSCLSTACIEKRRHSLLSPAGHLTISSTFSRGIIRLQHSRLRFIGLRESIPTLFAHALNLANFSNSFLKLFHSVKSDVSAMFLNGC